MTVTNKSAQKPSTPKSTPTAPKNDAPSKAEDLPAAAETQLKLWIDSISRFLGDFKKLSSNDLSKALAAALNHFENVGNRSSTEVGRLYLGLVTGNGDKFAKMVKLIAKKGYAITIDYDKDSGTVKPTYKVKPYRAIGDIRRSRIMAMLGEGKINQLYLDLKAEDEADTVKIETVTDKLEKVTKSFDRMFKTFEEVSTSTSKQDDLSAIKTAIYHQKKVLADLEDRLDLSKISVVDKLTA